MRAVILLHVSCDIQCVYTSHCSPGTQSLLFRTGPVQRSMHLFTVDVVCTGTVILDLDNGLLCLGSNISMDTDTKVRERYMYVDTHLFWKY